MNSHEILKEDTIQCNRHLYKILQDFDLCWLSNDARNFKKIADGLVPLVARQEFVNKRTGVVHS